MHSAILPARAKQAVPRLAAVSAALNSYEELLRTLHAIAGSVDFEEAQNVFKDNVAKLVNVPPSFSGRLLSAREPKVYDIVDTKA